VLGGGACAVAAEIQPFGSNCLFDPNREQMCQESGQKIPIPCESQCKQYYVCQETLKDGDKQLVARPTSCGILKNFDVAANECTTKADCVWYKQPPTASTAAPTTPGGTTPRPGTTARTTPKPSAAPAPAASAAICLLFGLLAALASRNLY